MPVSYQGEKLSRGPTKFPLLSYCPELSYMSMSKSITDGLEQDSHDSLRQVVVHPLSLHIVSEPN